MKILGLMSGTSMDGLDCCLADLTINKSKLKFHIIDSSTFPYENETKKIIFDSIFHKKYSYDYLNKYLGNIFSKIIDKFLQTENLDLISNHGQTISHLDKQYSIQVSSPKIINKNFKVPVVYDFRKHDIQNGGNGAPLMPLLDWYLFQNSNVLAVNIGGISNISLIIKNGGKNSVIGFDTGPGMCLIDLYVKTYWNQQYDIDGSLASKGNIDELMLDYLMKDKFVIKSYPKSASTEMYDCIYLSKIEKKFQNIKRYDFLRTLVNFTSISIIDNIKRINIYPELSDMKIIMSGGGVKNKILFNDINRGLINNRIVLMDYDGLNVDNKESFLMCLLGYTRYFNIPNNMPSVTGANKNIVCGEIYE